MKCLGNARVSVLRDMVARLSCSKCLMLKVKGSLVEKADGVSSSSKKNRR